jgi:hypothetical protein
MRSILSLAVLAVALVALILGPTPLRTGAQSSTPAAADQGFVGAWHLTTETPFGASQSLITLSSDGTVLFTDRPVYPGGEGFPVTFISTAHGSWEQTSPTTAAATWVEFMTDGEGNFLGIITDSIEVALSADGSTWSGPFSSTTTDPAGSLLFVGTGTVQAERITVQPLATPAATPAA